MTNFWDSRYANPVYAYGIQPNDFFQEALDTYEVTGKILLPAEGEGRNAVYAAKKGLAVSAFDTSIEGRKKALALAEKEKVIINYEVGNLFDLSFVNDKFDAAALIYAHLPPPVRSSYNKQITAMLKVGGLLILEGFSTGHLPLRKANPSVGGPDNLEMLFSIDEIKSDFPGFEVLQLEEVEIELNEGLYHNGRGKVIRFIGRKL